MNKIIDENITHLEIIDKINEIVDYINELQNRFDSAKKVIEDYQNDFNKG